MTDFPVFGSSIVPDQLLTKLSEIALQIHQTTESDEIFRMVVKECGVQLQTDRLLVYRLMPEANAIVLAETTVPEWTPLLGTQLANSCPSQAWIEGYNQHPWNAIEKIDTNQIGEGFRNIWHRFQVQASLIVPILVQEKIWGLLIAHQCRSDRAWQPLEVQFLQQVAQHLGTRIQVVENLQATETALRQYEQIISATPDCVALVDRNYIYRFVNQSYVDWYQKSSNEIIDHPISQLLGHTLFERLKPRLDRCLAGETISWTCWRNYPGVGHKFIRGAYTPFAEPDGTISGVVVNIHDLTELKRAEVTLAESEERFRQMADNICEVFWMADIQFTQMLYISPAYEAIWGRTCASLYAQPKSFLEAVHPDDRAHVLAQVEQHRQDGFDYEYRIIKPDGTIRWIWEQGFPVQDAAGHPYRLVGISQDITDRKQAEENLRFSEEQRRLAMDLNQLGSWDWNLLTGELGWSKQTFAIMGFAPDSPAYLSWRDRLPVEDLERLYAAIAQSQENHTSFNCECRVNHPDGSTRWILSRGKAIYDEANRPVRMIGFVMDISDRKQLEMALQNSEERYRQIVETATEGIWILDANNATTFVNPCMAAMLGYTSQEMMGKTLYDFMDEEGRAIAAMYVERRRQGIVEQFDFKLKHKGGSDVWTLVSTCPLLDESGQYVGALGMLADITQRKLAELALQQQTQREQALNRVFQAIRHTLDLDTIFATATTETAYLLDVEQVCIDQYLSDQLGWQSVSCFRRAELTNTFGLAIPEIGDAISDQLQQGKYVCVDDAHTLAKEVDCRMAQPLPGAWLLMPVMNQDAVWGCLTVNTIQQPFSWSEAQIGLVQAVADQLAIAIQQANLYRQTQLELTERQRAEAALQQLNQQLEQRVQERTQALKQQAEQEQLLRLCIQKIHRSLDFEEILATVLDETRLTIQADRVAIYQFLADWSGQFIAESVGEGWVQLVGGGIKTVWEDTYLQKHQGGRYRDNEILVVDDIYTAGLSQCHIDILEQFQIKAYATIPIFVDNQLWGLLAVYQNRDSYPWHNWEIQLLRQISLQLAIALRQSNLYHAAQVQVKELEKLHQLKDDFLSTVSHELRSPLTNIKMSIQLVELSLDQLKIHDDRLTQYLQILKSSCTQELTLINDLLDLQRLEAGMQFLEVEKVDLNYWLPAIVEPFETRAREQHQQFILDLPSNLPTVTTDLTSLKRILMELLHNACKYTSPHEQIVVTVSVCSECLQIQVCNTGVELPPEELPRLFEKFYRVAGADRWKHGGTGLGLALVKRLVEYLNGSIELKNENSLICFTIQLPINVSLTTKS